MADFRLETDRLALRSWRDCDAEPMFRINTDPAVMAYIGPLPTHAQATAEIERRHEMQERLGYCYWALEDRFSGELMGFCGLEPGLAGTPVEGGIEIGWRLARTAWGKGLAKEAALRCLDWGFSELATDAIFSKTVPANERSWRLMRAIGMEYVEGADFNHPALPDDHPLRRHVLYRIDRPQ